MYTLKDYYIKLKEYINKLMGLGLMEEEKIDEEETPVVEEKKDGESNLVRYPYILSVEDDVIINDSSYRVYNAYFDNLFDLYAYLNSNPEINEEIFYSLSSETGSFDFAGKPYAEAVEDLIAPLDKDYDEFLSIQGDISSAVNMIVRKYEDIYDYSGGGDIDYVKFASAEPDFYVTRKRVSEPKFITLYVGLSYYHGTNKKQVWNRAAIITNIVKALEKAGFTVSVKAFEMSREDDEAVCITVNLKNPDATLDMVGLYKSLCRVEFLRRILFRVLETMPVKNNWRSGYGETCSESFIKSYFDLRDEDIFFDQPSEMNVSGKDFYKDLEAVVKHLKLQEHIDLNKAKSDYESYKALRKI